MSFAGDTVDNIALRTILADWPNTVVDYKALIGSHVDGGLPQDDVQIAGRYNPDNGALAMQFDFDGYFRVAREFCH